MVVATPYTYITPDDVAKFLLIDGFFDANSLPDKHRIAHHIVLMEGEFDKKTGTAFRPRLVTEEVHDLEAHRSRYYDFLNDWLITRRPVHLDHGPLIPFDTTRGHKLEVYEGSDGAISATAPQGQWTDYLATKVAGRTQDYWADLQGKVAYFRKTFLFRRHALMRVTYEYGKPITTLTSPIVVGATTVNVVSTWRYETRGFFRVGDEYFQHTGKTATTFTGVTGGQFDTSPVAHSTGDEVLEIPEDVRKAIAQKCAVHFLQNERYTARIGDSSSGSPSLSENIREWNQEYKDLLSYYTSWKVL